MKTTNHRLETNLSFASAESRGTKGELSTELPPWPPLGNRLAVASHAPDCRGALKENGSRTFEVDARGLEPPEPMLRILSAVEVLCEGVVLRARTDRRPIHLLPELSARGVQHESEMQTDGSWITTLRRA